MAELSKLEHALVETFLVSVHLGDARVVVVEVGFELIDHLLRADTAVRNRLVWGLDVQLFLFDLGLEETCGLWLGTRTGQIDDSQ